MPFIRKNFAFLLLTVSLTIIASCFAYALYKKDDVTFYLKDIRGDRSALNGITISGVLQDRFHGQYFEISNGRVRHRFKYYQKGNDIIEPESKYASAIAHDDLLYNFHYESEIPHNATVKTEPDTEDISNSLYGDNTSRYVVIPSRVQVIATIQVYNKDFFPRFNYFSVPTGVFLENNDSNPPYKKVVVIYPNGRTFHDIARWPMPSYGSLANCMTTLDGKLYFTIPTTGAYSGENGIFVVDEFEFLPLYSGKYKGKGRQIAQWSLSDNMDVLGLKSISDKLVLITAMDNILTLKLYDEQGNLLDQTAINDIILDNTSGTADIDVIPEDDGGFEAYTNDNVLNICIYNMGFDKRDALVSIKVDDEIIPLQTISRLDLEDNEVAQYHNIYAKEDKAYIVASVQRLDEGNLSKFDPLRPRHLVIMVYRNSKLIYKGELITDVDEDFELDRLKGEINSYSKYDPFRYRQFYGIELR